MASEGKAQGAAEGRARGPSRVSSPCRVNKGTRRARKASDDGVALGHAAALVATPSSFMQPVTTGGGVGPRRGTPTGRRPVATALVPASFLVAFDGPVGAGRALIARPGPSPGRATSPRPRRAAFLIKGAKGGRRGRAGAGGALGSGPASRRVVTGRGPVIAPTSAVVTTGGTATCSFGRPRAPGGPPPLVAQLIARVGEAGGAAVGDAVVRKVVAA